MKETNKKKSPKDRGKRAARPNRARAGDGIRCIYLYYLVYANGVRTKQRVYEWVDPSGPIDDAEDSITKLARNAYLKGNNPPVFTTEPRNYMQMRRKSYLAFVVETDGPLLDSSNPITFLAITSVGYAHTFQYVKSISATVYDEDDNESELEVAYFINSMQAEGASNLGKTKWEEFAFTAQFQKQEKRRRGPDTGGTNMGPPVPPPARKRKKAGGRS